MTQSRSWRPPIRYYVLRKDEDIHATIKGAATLAVDSRKPVAVLLTKDVLGRHDEARRLLKIAADEIGEALVITTVGGAAASGATSGRATAV